MACFPDSSFTVPCLHTANHGLASISHRERAHYLFAMARVMSRWKWVDPCGWIAKVDKLKWTVTELANLEKEIATFYTQTFHNCFRRAPVIPRRLSKEAVALSATMYNGAEHTPIYAPHIENDATVVLNAQTRFF